MIALKNILVATDFSEPADAALLYGRTLARTFNATLHVVHVIGHISTLAYTEDASAVAMLPHLQREAEEAARQALDDMLIDNDTRPLPVKRTLLVAKAPAAAIVEYAQREPIDLIITGTHGRGAVSHLLLGSVAERVVRTAPCPVLTIRQPEREFVKPDVPVAVARV
jgi:nucleotide-binding universal stress UspA family protein